MRIALDKRGEGNSKGSDNKSMDFVGMRPNSSATLAPRVIALESCGSVNLHQVDFLFALNGKSGPPSGKKGKKRFGVTSHLQMGQFSLGIPFPFWTLPYLWMVNLFLIDWYLKLLFFLFKRVLFLIMLVLPLYLLLLAQFSWCDYLGY